VVLAPIFALWLGLGIWSKVALGVTLVFFIVFFNVYQGVKEVSPTVLDNGRMLGMNERQLTRHVTGRRRCRGCFRRCTPRSALPWSARRRRISGIGGGPRLSDPAGRRRVRRRRVFAGMFVLSAFVILIDMVVTVVERKAFGMAAGGCHTRIDRRIRLAVFVTAVGLIVIRLVRSERAW
jgi:NitT/TauT family transport system permease protein